MPNFTCRIKTTYTFTGSPRRNNIYTLCLWIPEDYKCIILTTQHVPKLKIYSPCSKMYIKQLLHCTESVKRDSIKIFSL